MGMALAENFGLDRGKPVDDDQSFGIMSKIIQDEGSRVTSCQNIGMTLAKNFGLD